MKDMSQNLNVWLKRASLQAERYAMLLGFLLLLSLVISAQFVIYSSFEARGHINHLHQLERDRKRHASGMGSAATRAKRLGLS